MKTTKRIAVIGLFALTFLNIYAAFAQGTDPVIRDPFVRPTAPATNIERAQDAVTTSVTAAKPVARKLPAVPLLTAVLYRDSDAFANFEGHIVTIGQSVGGWEVMAIDEQGVVLGAGPVRRTVTLAGG